MMHGAGERELGQNGPPKNQLIILAKGRRGFGSLSLERTATCEERDLAGDDVPGRNDTY